MESDEYNKLLPTIPPNDKRAFIEWYAAHQDVLSWEQFKSQGFKNVIQAKKDFEQHIEKVTGKPKQLQLAFMPKEIARTSPFFPMSKKEMKERPAYKDLVIENNWGKITFSGSKLSIYDESVLLATLALSKKHKTDTFSTTYSELCKLMNVARGKTQYESIRKGLIRLTQANVCTELYKDTKEKKVVDTMSGAMIAYARQQENHKVDIMLNPYFLTMYANNMTSYLNLNERAKIKGDVAKALYRFLQTHQAGEVPFGLMTICHAVNLNTELSLGEIRKRVRKALSELREKGHIKKWGIYKGDVVRIQR